jgi:predicted nucleotidyltransferase
MSKVEKVSIALTSDMAATVRGAVASGEYASSSEVVREALREWRHKRNPEYKPHQPVVEKPVVSRKNETLLDKLRLQKIHILALAKQYGAQRLRIFGSVARHEERADSDVNILVDFPTGYSMYDQRLPLTSWLEDLIGRKVNLTPVHELPESAKQQALKEAVEL